MKERDRRSLAEGMLNSPMGEQSIRLHICELAPGLVDGCSSLRLRGVGHEDLMLYAIQLRRLARSVERGMLETVAEGTGMTVEELSAICDEAAATLPDHDSVMEVRDACPAERAAPPQADWPGG